MIFVEIALWKLAFCSLRAFFMEKNGGGYGEEGFNAREGFW